MYQGFAGKYAVCAKKICLQELKKEFQWAALIISYYIIGHVWV